MQYFNFQRLVFLTTLILLWSYPLHAQDSVMNTCLGEPGAQRGFIYLHGLDPDGSSAQERRNRRQLDEFGKKHRWVVIAPRSPSRCRGQLCWKHGSYQDQQMAWRFVSQASLACLRKGKTRLEGLIAFSNGAYLAHKWLATRMVDELAWLVLVGGFSSLVKLEAKTPERPKVIFASGVRDQIFSKMKLYAERLDKKVYQFFSFPGGHEIPNNSILDQMVRKLR